MDSAWHHQLKEALIQKQGAQKGSELYQKYQTIFPAGYREEYSPDNAVEDISEIEAISPEHLLSLRVFNVDSSQKTCRLKVFVHMEQRVPLSDIMPILEKMGLEVDAERLYKLTFSDKSVIEINDFSILYEEVSLFNDADLKAAFWDAFYAIWFKKAENDDFNQLILKAKLNWREATLIRAYSKYLQQIGVIYSQATIQHVCVLHADIIQLLLRYFKTKFSSAPKDLNELKQIEEEVSQAIDQVTSLDDDKILRYFLHLMIATQRTNFFLTDTQGQSKHYLSLKLKSNLIPGLPLPLPLYEIFVYSPRFEGIHLRSSKVARGGIRWSDRRDDFRTEILGLMKAQTVKNAVIVPSGSKGGFFPKQLPVKEGREAIQKEGIACYQAFICGLLDLTDNYVDGKVVFPKGIVCYDEADPYLVVAADKGTAAFSDIANEISNQYHYWLGDAFASGGSSGYDHKKMGITARGAWESVKRHFLELKIDWNDQDFTVVGIGDMSGDVFGNGMLYSKHIKLVAAFDHRHIFLDPNGNSALAYEERLRLFNLPNSSWEDYNPSLISKGGGVFKRSLKSIPLSPEVQAALDVHESSMDADHLIQAILKAPVDLLWNGGIGTYVKSSSERHSDVQDRTNDRVRINGNELRCRVVAEGGNLGFTQQGRIEYALQGGGINTDSIDNSAGVDCSDHEVNIKILLNDEMSQKQLTLKERNELLTSMTEEVAKHVLRDNYKQNLAISMAVIHENILFDLQQEYLQTQESAGHINRSVEFLPDNKMLLERKTVGKGFTRPEISILLSYAKNIIKKELLSLDILEDPFLSHTIQEAFPQLLLEKYPQSIQKHKLCRELTATQISNDIVNQMGFTFTYLLSEETGSKLSEIIRAYTIASTIFKMRELQGIIQQLEGKVPIEKQYAWISYLRSLISLTTRWLLYNVSINEKNAETARLYSDHIDQVIKKVPTLITGEIKYYYNETMTLLLQMGLTEDHALRIATCRALYTILNVIDLVVKHSYDLMTTAETYFKVGSRFHLVWFRDQLNREYTADFWNNYLGRVRLRDYLDVQQKLLTRIIMRDYPELSPNEKIETWIQKNQHLMNHWEKVVTALQNKKVVDFLSLFLTLGELANLTRNAD